MIRHALLRFAATAAFAVVGLTVVVVQAAGLGLLIALVGGAAIQQPRSCAALFTAVPPKATQACVEGSGTAGELATQFAQQDVFAGIRMRHTICRRVLDIGELLL